MDINRTRVRVCHIQGQMGRVLLAQNGETNRTIAGVDAPSFSLFIKINNDFVRAQDVLLGVSIENKSQSSSLTFSLWKETTTEIDRRAIFFIRHGVSTYPLASGRNTLSSCSPIKRSRSHFIETSHEISSRPTFYGVSIHPTLALRGPSHRSPRRPPPRRALASLAMAIPAS